MKNLILGLDIGITSVGWGIIEKDTGNIIDAGVRLFEEGTAEENAKRRGFRSSRRLKRRKAFRIYRLEQLLKENNILNKDYRVGEYNPYKCRLKGLTSKLNNNELVCALLHIAKLRGSSLEVAIDENNKDEGLAKDAIRYNSSLLNQGKYVVEIQLERLEKDNKIRGHQNIFKTVDYLKELDAILSNQDLNNEIKEKIKDIISSRRHFSEGPGGKNSPTQYGRYLTLDQEEPIDLILKMRGKCSIYKDKYRAPINSYTYCLYNLYNDFNNLILDGRKMSTEEKERAINDYINVKGTITLRQIAKICNVQENLISGYRQDSKEKAIFTEFKGYNAIRKLVDKELVSRKILEDKNLVDRIIDVLTETKIIEERIERLSKFVSEIDAIELSKISSVSQYGFLSYEALKLFINEMKDSNENQMQISTRLNLSKEYEAHLKNKKTIPFIGKDITNPVVIRAQRETIKIINKVREKYGELESVVIEMAREKNSKEEKEALKKLKAKNEEIKKSLQEFEKERPLNASLQLKLRLWLEQGGRCAYTNEPIILNTLLFDDTAYEVDHILPLSLSFDDSYNNKVLVTRDANQTKGQRTPYEYFAIGKGIIGFDKFKELVLANKNYSKKKKDNLLFLGNLLDDETQSKFIARNLQDTRFASRNILNELKQYYKVNDIDTKVFVVRGSITNQFRKKAKIKKDRDVFKHHAIDALIVATIRNNTYLISKLDKESRKERKYSNYVYKTEYIIDNTTGEIINDSFFDEDTMIRISKIRHFDKDENFKFSWKVDRKVNRSISDQTIYSTRIVGQDEFIVKKYKNIYDNTVAESIVKMFKEGKSENLLIYKHDRQTYELIKTIIESYPTEKNPFVAYKKEYGDIRKYSKKGNGPIITQLKYIDSKLGNHIDISNKYQSKDKRIVLLQISPFRMDVYLDKGIYKFVTIRYSNIMQIKGKNFINPSWYENQKIKKKISSEAKFMFSFHRNEIVVLEKDGNSNLYKFIAVNNDNNNQVEVKLYDSITSKQTILSIGKKITKILKYNVDVLGNMYKVENEVLKLEF